MLKIESNPDFEKVRSFLEDLLILHSVSKNMAFLLFEMIPYLNPRDNIIVNAYLKKELAMKTGMSKGTIDNAITKLNEVGLFERLDRGTYAFHPVLHEVKKLLNDDTAKVKISYTQKNRVIETD